MTINTSKNYLYILSFLHFNAITKLLCYTNYNKMVNIVGIALGIKLVNGKIKLKFDKKGIIDIVIMIIIFIASLIGLIPSILNFNIELIFVCLSGICVSGYLLLISPYTQNPENYYIEFESENSLNNLKLSYKNKLVTIRYKIDNNGKITFYDNNNKLSCISYKDGSNMSNLTKYKIMNYFAKWLNDNGLMSDEITTTFE